MFLFFFFFYICFDCGGILEYLLLKNNNQFFKYKNKQKGEGPYSFPTSFLLTFRKFKDVLSFISKNKNKNKNKKEEEEIQGWEYDSIHSTLNIKCPLD